MGSFLKITEVAQLFDPFFHGKRYMFIGIYFFTQNGLGYLFIHSCSQYVFADPLFLANFRVNYNFYIMAKFAKVMRKHPGSTFADTSRRVARRWSNITDDHKEHYNRLFRKDLRRYYREVRELWNSLK
jgi:hypothetical protein